MRLPLHAFAAAAILVLAVPAFAQTDQAQPEQAQPEQAQPDQPAAQPGQGHRMSPEAREAMRKACATDIQTYCGDATANGGRGALGRCLRQNFDKLSGDCQTQLKAMRAQRRQGQQPQ